MGKNKVDSSPGQGIGGKPLDYSNSLNRVYLGGGGGAGDMNNNVGTSGQNGGGIVIIIANSIIGNNHYIKSNGSNVEEVSEMDGSGGGGAGGTILLHSSINSSSILNIEINGGKGGNSNPPFDNTHSPGGGGSGGILWTMNSIPTNTNVSLSGGEPGLILNPNSPHYNSSYGATSGENGGILSGLIVNESNIPYTPLEIDLGNDTTICSNENIILDPGIGYSNYLWQDGSEDTSFVVYNSGTYWVEVIDTFGCTGSDTIHIDFYPSPEINLGNDTLLCQGDSIIINANGNYNSYIWNTGSTDSSITVYTSGIYIVEVYNDYSCSTVDSIQIDYYPYANEELELGPDTIFCPGTGFILNAGSGYTSYQWQDGSNDSIFIADTAGIYWVFVENPCSSGSDTIVLEMHPQTIIDLGNDTTVCHDEYVLLNPGFGFYSYLWQDGSTNQFLGANQTGSYWVEVEDENGCFAYDTINLVFVLPDPEIGNDTSICSGDSVTFHASEGFVNYFWNNGSEKSYYTASIEGLIWCEVIDTMGCIGSDSVYLDILFAPSISLGNDTAFCDGDSLRLVAYPESNGYMYSWQDGSADSTLLIWEEGLYWIMATNVCGTSWILFLSS
ncbi:MAG: hypothetical protein R2764_08875 [Bacteroidales bacterium]